MPNSVELYLILKAVNAVVRKDPGQPSDSVLSDAPPPLMEAGASDLGTTSDKTAQVPPLPLAPMPGAATIDRRPPSPPAPMHIGAIIDHRPPHPPAPMEPGKALAALHQASAQTASATTRADSPAPNVPATVLSVALEDVTLQPPKLLQIQSVAIYGSREMALAWLASVDGQRFSRNAQALQLLRVSADDNV